MRRLLQLTALLLLMASPAIAQDSVPDIPDYLDIPDPDVEVPLADDALRSLFLDRTHRGFYDLRGVRNGANNFTEVMSSDGTSLHTRNGVDSSGTWRTRGPVVCFDYGDLNGGCFSVYLRGTCHYVYSVTSKRFVAVSVIDGATPTCEAPYV